MSDTLRPQDLTAEERALVDVEACRLNALGALGLPQLGRVHRAALANVESLILARRKFYGAPEEAKAAGNVEYACQPAPPPAPVASELPEAVQGALDVLRRSYTEWVPPSDAVRKKAHDALEAWARSLPAAQAVGMTPELEDLCESIMLFADCDPDTQVKQLWRKKVAAVRAQAASAQAVPGQVEVIPIGLWQLEELLKYADLAEVALRTGFHPPDFLFDPADCSLRNRIDAVKEQRDRYLAAVEGGK